jgi:hypothetical protein
MRLGSDKIADGVSTGKFAVFPCFAVRRKVRLVSAAFDVLYHDFGLHGSLSKKGIFKCRGQDEAF